MIWWVLFIHFVAAELRIRESVAPWIPDDADVELPDATDYMTDIHSPSSDVAYIHQLSQSFLRITKDILSFRPRSINPSRRQTDTEESLRQLRNIGQEQTRMLMHDNGVPIPETPRVSCEQMNPAYRTMDGSCNNLNNPCWGKTEEPYQRLLLPDYGDGISELRKSYDGSMLPDPRSVYLTVSSHLNPSSQSQLSYITNLFVSWGQLLSHDMLLTPVVKMNVPEGGKIVSKKLTCCNSSTLHPDCAPMYINERDIYYPLHHCLEFVRSAQFSHRESSCKPLTLGNRREQINQLTAFIDASVVYGSSEEEMRKLREHNGKGAKLLMSRLFGRPYLPRKNTTCKSTKRACDKRCHMGGENRANENPVLAALHTLLARQHNRLVDQLRHRSWDEETLFHVVRKIVGAQMQHITYNEYMHLLLGDRLSDEMKLSVPTKDYKYDETLNPTLFNSFVTAAYRYGHSMVATRQKRRGTKEVGSPVLSQDFFSMDEFCDTKTDSITRLLGGQAEQKAQMVDAIFSKELTNHLFAKRPEGPGLDLVSINIQRGRDHGIPSYNHWRQVCNLKPARDYEDLLEDIPAEIVERFATVYGPGHVEDIDLYIAGISERPVNDGILGRTYTCIVANQFRNLKFGDRFWYENYEHAGAFTEPQLNEIRKTTIASLICENTEVGEIQALAFIAESPNNIRWPCEVILQRHRMNLDVW